MNVKKSHESDIFVDFEAPIQQQIKQLADFLAVLDRRTIVMCERCGYGGWTADKEGKKQFFEVIKSYIEESNYNN